MCSLKVSLVTDNRKDIPDWVLNEIDKSGINLTAQKCKSSEELLKYAKYADVIWTRGKNEFVTDSILPELNCKAIMRSGSGLDDIPVKAAEKLGIKALNTPEAIAEIVAEHAVSLLFSLTRQIPQHDKSVRNGEWKSEHTWAKWHVSRQTIGLIGFGLIAQNLTKMLKGFNMKFLVFDPYADKKLFESYGVEEATFDDVLKNSDFISLHCPLNDNTYHSFGKEEFEKMKKNAFLINTSRGAVINEKALIKALEENWIAGAALDVTEEEPPKPDNPLLKLENVILTPHIAAFSDEFAYKFWKASIEKLKTLK